MALHRLTEGHVATIEPSASLAEAARRMTMFSVGALVIAPAPGAAPVGIVTDRDLVKLIGEGADPLSTTLEGHVSTPVATASVEATRSELIAQMSTDGIRRLPLLDDRGALVGLVSLDDLLIELGRELGAVAGLIQNEFAGEHPTPSARARAL